MATLRDAYEAEAEARRLVFDRMLPRQHDFLLLTSNVLEGALETVPQREVPRIDALFEVAVPGLHYGLQTLIPSYWTVGVTGSFVHGGGGRYLAHFGDSRCEIGDLLVVAEFRLFHGLSARNAVLIQAKKPLDPPTEPWADGSGPTQFVLYNKRPPFTWDPEFVARARVGEARTLAPADVDCPCPWDWHAFGTRHWSRWSDWTAGPIYGGAVFAPLRDRQPWVAAPIEPVEETRPLASVIVDLLSFVGGYPFVRRHAAYEADTLEWSAVVWDLLQSSRARHYRRVRPDRTDLHLLEDEIDPENADVEASRRRQTTSDDDERGVSVVRFVFFMND